MRHPANQIQLADGQGWPTADGAPIEWAPAQAYDFANVGVARNGDLLVVSYDAVVSDLVMEGDEYRETASPRLLTYLLSPEGVVTNWNAGAQRAKGYRATFVAGEQTVADDDATGALPGRLLRGPR